MTKLHALLGNPVFDESWAVNLLVQIRKIIDSDRKKKTHAWSVVNLFCTWALHSELTRDKFTIALFFKAFDFRNGMEMEDFFASEYFRNFVALHMFRRELASFLKEHGLPTWLVDETDEWLRFVYLYVGAVADAPIAYSPNGILPEELQELRLDRLSDRSGLEYVRTRARLKDGRDYFSMHLIPLLGDVREPLFAYLRRRYPDTGR
jgi:hypothetical protein